jgi:hypothetical protein
MSREGGNKNDDECGYTYFCESVLDLQIFLLYIGMSTFFNLFPKFFDSFLCSDSVSNVDKLALWREFERSRNTFSGDRRQIGVDVRVQLRVQEFLREFPFNLQFPLGFWFLVYLFPKDCYKKSRVSILGYAWTQ